LNSFSDLIWGSSLLLSPPTSISDPPILHTQTRAYTSGTFSGSSHSPLSQFISSIGSGNCGSGFLCRRPELDHHSEIPNHHPCFVRHYIRSTISNQTDQSTQVLVRNEVKRQIETDTCVGLRVLYGYKRALRKENKD